MRVRFLARDSFMVVVDTISRNLFLLIVFNMRENSLMENNMEKVNSSNITTKAPSFPIKINKMSINSSFMMDSGGME